MSDDLVINDDLVLPGAELEWTAVRASGAGGQNVNKVSSKVELRFDIDGSRLLSEFVKSRLRARCGRAVDAQGVLRITSQRFRDQHRNLEEARQKLRALILVALVVPPVRRATRPTRSSVQRRLTEKSCRARVKRARKAPADSD